MSFFFPEGKPTHTELYMYCPELFGNLFFFFATLSGVREHILFRRNRYIQVFETHNSHNNRPFHGPYLPVA